MRTPFLALLFACSVLNTVAPNVALACSCLNLSTLQQEFDACPMVFSGRVMSVESDSYGMLVARVEPIQRWKGPLDSLQVVISSSNDAACGLSLAVGESYLFFPRLETYIGTLMPTPAVNTCQRTSPLAGNPYLSGLPAPLAVTGTVRRTWGSLKSVVRYR